MCSKGVSCKKIEDCDELYGTRSVLHLRSGKCRCNVTERVQHAAVISLKSTFTLNERFKAGSRADNEERVFFPFHLRRRAGSCARTQNLRPREKREEEEEEEEEEDSTPHLQRKST